MSFSQISVRNWPSHDCRPIAVLRPEPADLDRKLGIKFRDDRDDLDELKYAGLLLPSGDQVLLVRHRHAPKPGTEVYGDAAVDSALLLARFLAATGLSPDQVTWQLPATEPSKEAVEAITNTLRRASEGDLSARAPEGEGVLGDVAKELNRLLERLPAQIVSIHEASIRADSSLHAMLRAANQIAKNAAEEARAADEATASLAAMLQSAIELATRVEYMTRFVEKSATDKIIAAVMRKNIESISDLSDQTLRNAQRLSQLGPLIKDLANATARSAKEYRGAVETLREITKTADEER